MNVLKSVYSYIRNRLARVDTYTLVDGDVLVVEAGGVTVVQSTGASSGDVLTSNGAGSLPSWQAGVGGVGAPTGATYVTLTTHASLSAERTLAVGTGLSLTDGGANGPVTIAPDADLAAIEALGSTGLAVRTALNTWAQRTVTSSDGSVTITNPGGVAGNIDLVTTISPPAAQVFVFTTPGAEQSWGPPDGHSQCMVLAIDGGGGGGGGRTNGAGTQRGGGGGGACGAIARYSGFAPAGLYVIVGAGGAGGAAGGAGSDGTKTTVSLVSGSTSVYDLLLQAGGHATVGGGGGTNGGGSGAAGGGGAGQIVTDAAIAGSIGRFSAYGLQSFQVGQAGAAGGNATGAAGSNVTPPQVHLCTAGAGGGAVSSGNTAFAGGSVLAAGATAAVAAGTTGGGNGGAGQVDALSNYTGGGGGGGNAGGTGGTGGDGAIGCGGGGGGGGTTGGAGGDGGNGLVVIISW